MLDQLAMACIPLTDIYLEAAEDMIELLRKGKNFY
jgi:hypothetical protein